MSYPFNNEKAYPEENFTMKTKIRKWIKDFESQHPGNIQIDHETFEGSAYYLFNQILAEKGE